MRTAKNGCGLYTMHKSKAERKAEPGERLWDLAGVILYEAREPALVVLGEWPVIIIGNFTGNRKDSRWFSQRISWGVGIRLSAGA